MEASDDAKDFQQVAGIRYEVTKSLLADRHEMARVAMVAVIIESLRHLHHWWLKHSKKQALASARFLVCLTS